MNSQSKLTLLSLVILAINSLANRETIVGNSTRTSFLDVVGPESKNEILWEGSLPSGGGLPILVSDNKLVINKAVDWENAPIVCHDLFYGDTLWIINYW